MTKTKLLIRKSKINQEREMENEKHATTKKNIEKIPFFLLIFCVSFY